MGHFYNVFRRFCAFLTGAVFLVSGLLKLLDPVGAGLVIDEYYKFLGIGFMSFSSEPAGIFLALMEAFTGLALMTGVWRRAAAAAAMAFMAFFTLLTLALVIFNPVMDCGCFGEAVHLSHWQTFIKNLVLCALCAVAFFPFGRLGRPKKRKYVTFGIVGTAIIAFSIYHILYVPLVDFTAFRAGARLESSIDDASDVYDAAFIYEKDGKQRRFSLENLPDSTWTYVSTETERVGGSDEVVVQLPVSDAQGVHHDGLAAYGKALVISAYRPYGMTARRWQAAAKLVTEAYDAGFTPVVLVPEDLERMDAWLMDNLEYADAAVLSGAMYFADYKTLVTMNRSNGGAVYFHDGYLVRKWSWRNYPVLDDYSDISSAEAAELSADFSSRRQMMFQAFLLYVFAVLLFV
ncbi:MAG: hypothetical protein K2J62_07970 [Bacteroidales bacterium]|nr:hypothetical protein [Bacteroidales bacterium]